MATPTIAQAWIGLTPTLDGSTRAIQAQLAGGQMAAVGSKSGKVLGAGILAGAARFAAPLAAVFGAAAIVDFGKGAVAEASNLSESLNALKVTYGDLSPELDAYNRLVEAGARASRDLGLSQVNFNNLAVQFSAFSKTIADGDDAVGVLENITGRAADFASVMNLDVSEAARLFQSGLAGETEPLRRYGIDLSAAAVQSFAYANGLAKQGAALTEQQKVQARYGALMAQTALTQGDFANTSDGLANQQRILGAQWDNFKAQIGNALLPLVTKFVSALSGLVTWVSDAASGFGDFFKTTDGGAGTLGVFGELLQVGREQASAMAKSFRQNILPALKSLWASFQKNILPAIRDFVALFREHVLPHVQYLAGAINEYVIPAISKFVGWLFEATAAVWRYAGPALQALIAWFRDDAIPKVLQLIATGKALVQWFRNLPGNVRQAFANLADKITSPFRVGFDKVATFASNTLQWFKDLPGNIKKAFVGVADKIAQPFKTAFNSIARFWNNGPGRLQFTTPDWIPGIGGKGWGFPRIPLLAEGGVVTRPTLAMIGEGGHPEAVVPLSRASDFGFGGGDNELGPRTMQRLERALTARLTLIANEQTLARSVGAGNNLLAGLGAT